jgi:type II secretory pathway component PulC
MKFVHKTNGRIVDLPAHFATAKVAANFEPYIDEVEEDKVILEHSPNSQTRAGRKVRNAESVAPVTDEKVETE